MRCECRQLGMGLLKLYKQWFLNDQDTIWVSLKGCAGYSCRQLKLGRAGSALPRGKACQ